MAKGPIIIPLDGSTTAEKAVPLAYAMAGLLDADVRFVRVADPDESARLDNLTSAGEAFSKYALDLARDRGFDASRTSAHLLSGPPAATILDDARKQDAQGIVIASHGRSGFRATMVGSVADKVVRGADIPVLVVPGRGDDTPTTVTQILAPLDGSEDSERILPVARAIAKALGAKVTLMQAFIAVPPHAAAFEYYVPEAVEGIEESAKTYLQDHIESGESALVSQGDAAAAIVSAAQSIDADLVVMAASGKGLAGRLFLGSTTDRVLHSLHRPLLIVRPPASQTK